MKSAEQVPGPPAAMHCTSLVHSEQALPSEIAKQRPEAQSHGSMQVPPSATVPIMPSHAPGPSLVPAAPCVPALPSPPSVSAASSVAALVVASVVATLLGPPNVPTPGSTPVVHPPSTSPTTHPRRARDIPAMMSRARAARQRHRRASPPRGAAGIITAVPEPTEVRIDKWLWAARMFKTRSLASEACGAGHVKVDGVSVKPAKVVRVGDRLEVRTPGGLRILEVAGLGERRGPATVARALYVDHTPPPPPKDEQALLVETATRDRGAGRPSKRDLRELRRIRGF